jgi:hypothetical protein
MGNAKRSVGFVGFLQEKESVNERLPTPLVWPHVQFILASGTRHSVVYVALEIWSTKARVADTSIPCLLPPRRMGPAMASSSGARPAATSFCIELRKASGAPSSAARIGSGATSAPSAIPTAQASLMQASLKEDTSLTYPP